MQAADRFKGLLHGKALDEAHGEALLLTGGKPLRRTEPLPVGLRMDSAGYMRVNQTSGYQIACESANQGEVLDGGM